MQDLQKNITAVLEALKYSPENLPLKKHAAQLLIQQEDTRKEFFIWKRSWRRSQTRTPSACWPRLGMTRDSSGKHRLVCNGSQVKPQHRC